MEAVVDSVGVALSDQVGVHECDTDVVDDGDRDCEGVRDTDVSTDVEAVGVFEGLVDRVAVAIPVADGVALDDGSFVIDADGVVVSEMLGVTDNVFECEWVEEDDSVGEAESVRDGLREKVTLRDSDGADRVKVKERLPLPLRDEVADAVSVPLTESVLLTLCEVLELIDGDTVADVLLERDTLRDALGVAVSEFVVVFVTTREPEIVLESERLREAVIDALCVADFDGEVDPEDDSEGELVAEVLMLAVRDLLQERLRDVETDLV